MYQLNKCIQNMLCDAIRGSSERAEVNKFLCAGNYNIFSSFLFRWILFPCVHRIRIAHGRISSYTQMIAFENDKYKVIEEINIEVRFLLSAFDLFALIRVSLAMNWSDQRNETNWIKRVRVKNAKETADENEKMNGRAA